MARQQSAPVTKTASQAPRWEMGVSQHRLVGAFATYFMLVIGAVILMIPFFWMLSTSLKTLDEVNTWPITWIPSEWIWQNYIDVFQRIPFARFLMNSIMLATGGIVGSIISCSLPGFGFARLRFPGRSFLFFVMLTTLMMPAWVVIVPHFMMFNTIGWLDTFLPIVVPSFFGNAFYIFLFRQYFLGIPKELEDAARVDGCSTFRIFWQIFLPMSLPVIATVAVFAFFYYWNDLLYPLVYFRSQHNFPVSLGMRMFQTAEFNVIHYPRMMAAALMSLIPCILVFSFAQRLFIQGVVITGVEK
ncbi:MAG: carbohydrate ABC transporter permease [Chloroflexi bacterium]|nr:carbohydrate ABC transporter permease [Chloroflexota bacterium]